MSLPLYMASQFKRTKVGKVSSIKWAAITNIKLGRETDKSKYLLAMLDVIVKGTRFEEYVTSVKQAKMIKRKKKYGTR